VTQPQVLVAIFVCRSHQLIAHLFNVLLQFSITHYAVATGDAIRIGASVDAG